MSLGAHRRAHYERYKCVWCARLRAWRHGPRSAQACALRALCVFVVRAPARLERLGAVTLEAHGRARYERYKCV